ncbi:unnamed protein product [Ceratitis capitata]|uniref:(Mediterranean fruit fly) hypothetical protein n=1 Tax=Ceratitis capitata TaxID=7213 RepID=A0A811VGY0_CERCA|nr:unnamed protein product [Ceratitis capitata]
MEVENRPIEPTKSGCDSDAANISPTSSKSADLSQLKKTENCNDTQNHKSKIVDARDTNEEGNIQRQVDNKVVTSATDKNEEEINDDTSQEETLSAAINSKANIDKNTEDDNKAGVLQETIEDADHANITEEKLNTAESSNDFNAQEESQDAVEDEDSQKEYASTADDDNSLSHSTQSQTPPPKDQTTTNTTNTSIATAMGVAASVAVAAAGLSTTIPDTILSPPKSETQTDDANTATSSSPASDSQLSPITDALAVTGSAALTPTTPPEESDLPSTASASAANASGAAANSSGSKPSNSTGKRSATVAADGAVGGKRVVQPINLIANGTIPKSSGKPQMSAMNKKLKEKVTRTPKQRKQKSTLPIYESEISNNKTGIKLCIKKSDSTGNLAATTGALTPPLTVKSIESTATTPSKQTRKRSRKAKSKARVDSDESEQEVMPTKRGKNRGGNGERQKKVSFSGIEEQGEKHRASIEQGDWGARIPQELLYKIFQSLTEREGCFPIICRLARVCTLWRNVALTPTLWKNMDLASYIKDKFRTELKLKWFIDNRCSECTELNVANWKMTDINCFLEKLSANCQSLVSINLAGWKGFTSDHLAYLTENMKRLERIDLSSVNVEMNASKSAVGPQSLCNALQTMGDRLTHLYLAHNRLAGIPQIVATLATHCSNLVNLDLSNVTTQATSHGIFHIEKLQHGCPKLKVLRVTNSHITWSNATLQETMDSPGFPELEELSVAALTDECRVIGDDHLQRILKTSSKLKLLDVRGCARLTHESLIRLPAWDIKHLFLSFCSVTRDVG